MADESYGAGLGAVPIRYDDDRRLTFEPSFNGEVVVRLSGQPAIFVFAEDLRPAVAWACDEATAALPKGAPDGH